MPGADRPRGAHARPHQATRGQRTGAACSGWMCPGKTAWPVWEAHSTFVFRLWNGNASKWTWLYGTGTIALRTRVAVAVVDLVSRLQRRADARSRLLDWDGSGMREVSLGTDGAGNRLRQTLRCAWLEGGITMDVVHAIRFLDLSSKELHYRGVAPQSADKRTLKKQGQDGQ